MEFKSNVMRVLDKHKIKYKSYCYLGTGALSGSEVAAALGQNPACVFKTLVTVSKSSNLRPDNFSLIYNVLHIKERL